MYLRTVRDETRRPSLSSSSLTIRSSPHSGFSSAICRMIWRNSTRMPGRSGLDLNRQNRRQPAQCQRIIVPGRATTSASSQSHGRDSASTRATDVSLRRHVWA